MKSSYAKVILLTNFVFILLYKYTYVDYFPFLYFRKKEL